MNFEVTQALNLLGEGTDPYLIQEAFSDPDITMKRYAIEILHDLTPTDATQVLVAKIRLY